jgi:uncharacterized protein YfiM (DUF2279 family)
MTSLVIATFEATSGGQEPVTVKAHGLGHDKANHSTAGKAVGAAGVEPADLLRRKENRDWMHDFG